MFRTTPFTRYIIGEWKSRGDELPQPLLAELAAPHLAPAEEEALHAGEAVEHGRRLAAERVLVGVERHGQAAEVADVLARGQAAVDEQPVQRAKTPSTASASRLVSAWKRSSSSVFHHVRSTPFSSDFAPWSS